MTAQRETPASLGQQAQGDTGATDYRKSVPAWVQKRVQASLVRFRGEYLSPEALHAQAASEAARARLVGIAHGDALHQGNDSNANAGAGGSPILESPATPPAERFFWEPSFQHIDQQTGELLPCRSLETTAYVTASKSLPGPAKKVAAALTENIRYLCEKHGKEYIGFFTLTFADHVTDPAEAQRRLHSLATNVLNKRYPNRIRVYERQKNGRVHYHFVIVAPTPIGRGVDADAIARGDYKTASPDLRREWAFWHKTAKQYGFGRHNLQPVKSSTDALALYVGKYIGKCFQFRDERDKGVRLVSYSGDARRMVCKHTALTTHPEQWRAKVLTFSRLVAAWKPHARIRCMADLSFVLGKRWAYKHRGYIFSLPPADLSVPF